ncbi:MAG: hypothetical protein KKF44_03500 [Nanoarchaeota archaeon]|nr:hypothetical protein [Nanoarchaeota archaeon]
MSIKKTILKTVLFLLIMLSFSFIASAVCMDSFIYEGKPEIAYRNDETTGFLNYPFDSTGQDIQDALCRPGRSIKLNTYQVLKNQTLYMEWDLSDDIVNENLLSIAEVKLNSLMTPSGTDVVIQIFDASGWHSICDSRLDYDGCRKSFDLTAYVDTLDELKNLKVRYRFAFQGILGQVSCHLFADCVNLYVKLYYDCPGCGKCDLDNDGWVTTDDLIILQNGIDNQIYDSDIDTNGDGTVNQDDYTLCSASNKFGSSCFVCHDNVLEPGEGCEFSSGNYPSYWACSESICSGKLKRERTGCDPTMCSCQYNEEAECAVFSCGADCCNNWHCAQRQYWEEYCIESGLDTADKTSDFVVDIVGPAGFAKIGNSWCCEQDGEYYVKNYGELEIETNTITEKGEYLFSFAYNILDLPYHDEESIRIECGGNAYTISDYELTSVAAQQGNILNRRFTWYPGLSCMFTEGKNTIKIKSHGKDSVFLSSIRYTKYDARCNSETKVCEDRYACIDTDNGKDYFVKGTTTSGISQETMSDYCVGSGVKEYFCSQDESLDEEIHDCPNGCSNGACREECSDYIDNDLDSKIDCNDPDCSADPLCI